MIRRYSLPEMAQIFDEEERFRLLLEVEILATEAWSSVGVVPPADAAFARANMPTIDAQFIANVDEREKITNHDLAAFVDVVQDRVGQPAGKWIHYGLTSSDVVDTALDTVDINRLEDEFVKYARAYGERKKISYAAWREAGVEASVLKRAGIKRTD